MLVLDMTHWSIQKMRYRNWHIVHTAYRLLCGIHKEYPLPDPLKRGCNNLRIVISLKLREGAFCDPDKN